MEKNDDFVNLTYDVQNLKIKLTKTKMNSNMKY